MKKLISLFVTHLILAQGLLALWPAHSAVFAQSDLERGRELFKNKKYAEARMIFENISKGSGHEAEACYYLGSIYLRFERDPDKAIEYLEKAIEADNSKSEYHMALSNALGAKIMQSNVIKQAMLARRIKSELEKAVELNPNNAEARMSLLQMYVMMPGIMGGSITKARKQADALMQLNACLGYLGYAMISDYEEDLASAEAYYAKAIAAEPQLSRPYHQLGYLYLKQKRYEEAIKQFKKMAECDPGNANAYDSLGDGFLANDQLDDAMESYRKAVAIDPQFAPSVFNLAKCYEKKR
ncbi:tetratricopeptide repeat protein [bacterium]|nr:tetratricopeptide repeat protein [bacterium]